MEEAIEEIWASSQNDAGSKETTSPELSCTQDQLILKCLIAVAASVLLASFFSWVTWPFETSEIEDKVLNFMSGFVPFFVAVALGRSIPRLGWLSYAILGLLAGSLGFSQVALHYSTHNEGGLNPDFRLLALVYTGSGIFSFLTGGVLGQRMKGGPGPSAPSSKMTRALGQLIGSPESAKTIELLAPIVGAILNAIFVAVGLAKP